MFYYMRDMVRFMLPVKYTATITYKSTDNHSLNKNYIFFARDDSNAKEIAIELFLIDEGISNDMEVEVTPIEVTEHEELLVDRSTVKVLREVDKVVSGVNYVEFLNIFRKFEGKNLKLGSDASFNIEFMGFTFHIVMRNRQAMVCRDEFTYMHENRLYVVRLGKVYYGN